MMERSTIAPLLLRNLLTSILDQSLYYLSHNNYNLLQLLRTLLVSAFLFFLGLLPSYSSHSYPFKSKKEDDCYGPIRGGCAAAGAGDSGVSRALSQLLMIMNDIPVSSRKYEVVRSLAEKLLDDNLSEAAANNRVLRDVNCAVLSLAFARTLTQLEAAVEEQGRRSGDGDVAAGARQVDLGGVYSRASRLLKYFGCAAWRYPYSGSSAEKLAAELLWLAQKMAASGCVEEAVCKWALASNLASLALSAEPRLQGSLVKLSGKDFYYIYIHIYR